MIANEPDDPQLYTTLMAEDDPLYIDEDTCMSGWAAMFAHHLQTGVSYVVDVRTWFARSRRAQWLNDPVFEGVPAAMKYYKEGACSVHYK